MSANDLLDRLRAWDEGRPVPTTAALPFPRVPDAQRLVVAFVRMAGESSPWGVAAGAPDAKPRFYTVPEPRNADLHAAFVESFSAEILAHVGHPEHLPPPAQGESATERPFPRELLASRQLWMPGSTHVEMLHLLDFRYTLAMTGEEQRLKRVRALGRACGWLFRESTRPGQVRVHDATARLRQLYAFPAETVRQQHLGYLLAWLGSGDRDARLAAAARAEKLSVGVTMHPEYERSALLARLEDFNARRRANDLGAFAKATEIHDALVSELDRRWKLTVEAIRAVDADPRPDNPLLPQVVALGANECQFQYWAHEQRALRADLSPEEKKRLGSHPETDFSPPRAASRYFAHLHAFETANAELVHGDEVLLERALDAGNGFSGTVTAVAPGSKKGRAQWTLETSSDDALRLREESKVCLIGARKRGGSIVSVNTTPEGKREIVVDLRGVAKKEVTAALPDPTSAAWVGRRVRFLDDAVVGLSLSKGMKVWNAEGPGSWLTHAAPRPEATEIPKEPVGDPLSVVKALEG
ncbi:MAG: hypothetical protein R3A52_23685 [Polyangiales bacterium]